MGNRIQFWHMRTRTTDMHTQTSRSCMWWHTERTSFYVFLFFFLLFSPFCCWILHLCRKYKYPSNRNVWWRIAMEYQEWESDEKWTWTHDWFSNCLHTKTTAKELKKKKPFSMFTSSINCLSLRFDVFEILNSTKAAAPTPASSLISESNDNTHPNIERL